MKNNMTLYVKFRETYCFQISRNLSINALKMILLYLMKNDFDTKNIGFINYTSDLVDREIKYVDNYDVLTAEGMYCPQNYGVTTFFSDFDYCEIRETPIFFIVNLCFNILNKIIHKNDRYIKMD